MGSIGEPTPHQNDSAIPIVDFSRWHTSSKASRLAVARDLTDACRRVGFVYIVNHGLSQESLNKAFDTAKRLFALSHDEKMLAPHPPGPEVHRGYSYPGLEKVSQVLGGNADDDEVQGKLREIKDCKESYEIGSEKNPAQPNQWLPEEVLPGFRDFTTEFYVECYAVAREFLKAMALGIGLEDENFFLKYHEGINGQLRLLHYPSLPASDVESGSVARMPAHTDWGTITMLFQDDCGGLEVEDPNTKGKFVQATPMPGACVMNVGDLLMRWSNGESAILMCSCRSRADKFADYLKSTLHRVGLPPLLDRFEGEHRMTRERYSIPFFVSADPDALIEVLPECTSDKNPARYDPILQKDYGRMRAAVQYQK